MKRLKDKKRLFFLVTFFQVASGSVQTLVEQEVGKHSIFEQFCCDDNDSELEKKTRKKRTIKKQLTVSPLTILVSKKKRVKRPKKKYPSQFLDEIKTYCTDLEKRGNDLKKEKATLEKEKTDLLFSCFLKQVMDNSEKLAELQRKELEDFNVFEDHFNFFDQLIKQEEDYKLDCSLIESMWSAHSDPLKNGSE